MPSPKIKKGLKRVQDFSFVIPSKKELEVFAAKVEKIADRKPPQGFIDRTSEIIAYYRKILFLSHYDPSDSSVRQEVEAVKNKFVKARDLFTTNDLNLSYKANDLFTFYCMLNDDVIQNYVEASNELISYFNDALEEYKNDLKKIGPPNKRFRQVCLEEFARAYEEFFGEQPKKSSGSKFEMCVDELHKAINFIHNGKKLHSHTVEEYKPLIIEAVNNYPNKSPASLKASKHWFF
jgi:hypothetical protein